MTINELATARYSAWAPWMGVPIATSIGQPKWMPGLEQMPSAKPFGIFGKHETEFEFRLAYEHKLDTTSEKVRADLQRISARYPNERLVLLCWEDLSKPGEWCHRRMLADWLEGKGITVPELTLADSPTGREYVSVDGPTPPPHTQQLLFGDDFG